MEPRYSWLCPTARDRERFVDMQDRLEFARVVTIVVGALIAVTLALSTNGGWAILAAMIAMIAIVLIGGWRLERRPRPELWVFFSTVVNIQLMLALGAVLTGGLESLILINMLAVPVVMVGARFSNRGLAVGAPVSALLIIATTLGVNPGLVAAHPEALAVPLALVLCSAVYIRPLVTSDVRHRADSTLDQLTGLLNRRGLEQRFAEVAEQAALAGHPVSVVVADIDHFKRINDTHGHPVGDAVLRDIADAMRRNLRTFELLYRFGGEEFLLLLPGANADDAAAVAETLRCAIFALHPEGLPVACSFGVATADADDVVFGLLIRAADAALYDAKRFGRNRVERGAAVLTPVAA
ncbi:MAG: two-component system, cell cycle response regulator [Solirubrobacterales bacterium]|jgi:diguanylate cyclase (GGDEF)-like protein|nr:two-component system, cell cycle response regulator [Solirubrobacterales bacterium]